MKSPVHTTQTEKTSPSGNVKSNFFFNPVERSFLPFFGPTTIQPKLEIGQPGDKYEQQADRVADSVVQMSDSRIQRQPVEEEEEMLQTKTEINVLRKCTECEKERSLQKKENGSVDSGSTAGEHISSRLQSSRGSGSRLPESIQAEMSQKIGADFGSVSIHTDAASHELNRQLGAKAFTYGSDIYFNKGEYRPETIKGKKLLAHELTHTVQQQTTPSPAIQRTIGDRFDLSSPRFKGDPDLEACFDNEKIIKVGSKGEFVRKIQQALIDAGFPLRRFGADAIFGQETKAAVREFQRQSGLEFGELDGDVGPNTLSRLDSRFTGSSAATVEKTCESGIKTVTIDVVMMRGATENPAADIAFANSVFSSCCIEFQLGSMVTMPTALSDSLLGGDTDFLVGDCGEVSAEDLPAFITATSLFGLTNPIIAFYVDTLHETNGDRLRGVSVSPLCATGPRTPLTGMMSIANGADSRTFPHEIAHILMNTFADHSVTADNLQHVSSGATGENIAPVQCAIMYTRI